MSKQDKRDRGALRQVVKEMWPEIMATELYAKLQKESKEQLDFVQKLVRETLERMDERQKDVQAMILRELSKPPVPIDNSEKK